MGLNEIEVNRGLLAEVEATLKAKNERANNIQVKIVEMKKKVVDQMDKGLWDHAQTALLQARGLSVENTNALDEAGRALARVDSLKNAIAKAEEKERKDQELKNRYVPYSPEKVPVQVEPVQPPAPPYAAPAQDGF